MTKREQPGYWKQYYAGHKESRLAQAKTYYQRSKNNYGPKERRRKYRSQTECRFTKGRYNALVRGWSWDITYDQYKDIAVAPCFYCGKSTISSGHGLDRKDSLKGYYLDNVVACCKSCNRIKCNYLSFEEMQVAMLAVTNFRTKNT